MNKTSIFTLNIGQLLGRISNPYSCRATPQSPKVESHTSFYIQWQRFFKKYQNFRIWNLGISYTSSELVKAATFQVGRRTFFREHFQRRWHLPRAHKWSTNFCLQLYTINFWVALMLTVGSSSIGTPIIYYQTLQRNQNIPLPRQLCSMRISAVAEFKFWAVSHCLGCASAVLSSSLPQLDWATRAKGALARLSPGFNYSLADLKAGCSASW